VSSGSSDRLRRVQVRTTAIAMATVVVVLAAGAYGLITLFEREQVRQVDARLADASDFLQHAERVNLTLPSADQDTLAQVVDDRGHVLYATERLRDRPALRSVGGDLDPERPTTVTVDRGGRVRVVAIPFRDDWVLLASSLQPVDDGVATLRTALFVGLPVLAALLGLVLWIVVGQTLRPVHDAIEREERLVADVSHELRTPIAGVRALLESESDVPEEIALNRREALNVLTRLESIASGLLAMARLRADPLRLAEPVDLDEVVDRVVEMTTLPAGIEIDVSELSGGQVRGNEDDLEQMITNLVNNAVRHADRLVRVAVDEHDDVVTLVVSDDGAGIAPEDRERVFDRFTRLDDARGRDQGGAGLGLAITRSVVAAHGGNIVVREAATGGASFVVTLPASVAGSGGGTPANHNLSIR
jgi:signal transduction histidine kinase